MAESEKNFIENDNEKNKQETIVVDSWNEEYLQNILDLEKNCFPPDWQYDDAEEYYEEMLKDADNVNIFLKDDKKIVGYLLAVPFEKVFKSLKEYDAQLELKETEKSGILYLETIQILSEFRGKNGAEKLILKMSEEAKKRGIKKISIHARKANKFDEKIKKMFSDKVLINRYINKWHYGGDEPYEYIEVEI